MPALVVFHKANEALGSPDAGNYRAARSALEGAITVREAVENSNLLDGFPEDIQQEARAVLDSLPDEVNRGVLEALRSALESGAAVEVFWEENTADSAISHRVAAETERVTITLVTPHGRNF
ncbi:MAG TPA: hypothetical protein VGG09_15550 [Acidimicrobiales bacterium]|jgi:hypothetical protein